MDAITILIIAAIPLFVIGVVFLDRIAQSPYDYKDRIVNDLESKGFELVKIEIPKLFETGPFPRIEVGILPVQTRVMGVQGEKARYRIITYKDNKGSIKKSWIKINIVAFTIQSIKWNPEL